MEVVDINSGRILDDVSMEQAEQFSNLSWSPNGKDIVFTRALLKAKAICTPIISIQKRLPSLPTINTPITSQPIQAGW
jgi:hypothetical protein